MESLTALVARARSGDLEAYGEIVRSCERMVFAVALRVLRDPSLAQDAAQDAFVRAFRNLGRLDDAAAFPGWLRRIAVTTAQNTRRARRRTLLCVDDVPDAPILDDQEQAWTDRQRARLAAALLTLTPADRLICDRRYHGGCSIGQLARQAGVDDAAMRKRLQRIRDRLRKEIEMSEQHEMAGGVPSGLPARVVELLARPQLSDIPENPVGQTLQVLRGVFADCSDVTLPEIVDFAAARQSIGDDVLYVTHDELQRVDDSRILRYDLTLPLLLSVRYEGRPLRVFTAGKAYRVTDVDATHLEAFHQAEVLLMDARADLDQWRLTARVLQSVDAALGGHPVKIVPTTYAMCSQAWDLEVEVDGRWCEVLAWGVYTDRIVRHLGGDPAVHTAVGIGYGLERVAMLRYGIDDIRKVETVRIPQ